MPACPNCGTRIAAPSRIFSVIVEPEKGERGLTERKVGMYQCSKCGTKFPTVLSRQHYLIVAEEQLKEIQSELKGLKKDKQELNRKIEEMIKEQDELRNSLETAKNVAEIRQLEIKLERLSDQVAYLRKEKGELEQKVSKFR